MPDHAVGNAAASLRITDLALEQGHPDSAESPMNSTSSQCSTAVGSGTGEADTAHAGKHGVARSGRGGSADSFERDPQRQGSSGRERSSPDDDGPDSKTLDAENAKSRKQNIACDACRARKVRCQRVAGEEKCAYCSHKRIACTSYYVTQVTLERKLRQEVKDSGVPQVVPGYNGHQPYLIQQGPFPVVIAHPIDNFGQAPADPQRHLAALPASVDRPLKRSRPEVPPNLDIDDALIPISRLSINDPEKSHVQLLEYLFSPELVNCVPLGYRDRPRYMPHLATSKDYDASLLQRPSSAHKVLLNEDERNRLANDLLETYFQILQIRLPLVDEHFRERFHNPAGPRGPNSNVSIALVLAWGARFSEHRLIQQDREECSRSLPNGRKRSRIVLLLAMRLQWMMDLEQVDKIPTLDNILALIGLACMRGPNTQLCTASFRMAVGICLALGYNTNAGLDVFQDPTDRGFACYAFWLLLESSSYIAMYHRQRPILLDGDWDADLTRISGGHTRGRDGRANVIDWHTYQHAFNSLSRIFRTVSLQWWRPKVKQEGIPISDIYVFTDQLSAWREQHLGKVGVPTIWPPQWDFAAAIAACNADIMYHSAWPCVAAAMDDYGILELNMITRGEPLALGQDVMATRRECDQVKARVTQEAIYASLRISALTAVLSANHYLRLDPATVHQGIMHAGLYLAKKGRSEVAATIVGLREIGMVFPEAYNDADNIEALAAANLKPSVPVVVPPPRQQGVGTDTTWRATSHLHGSGSGTAPPGAAMVQPPFDPGPVQPRDPPHKTAVLTMVGPRDMPIVDYWAAAQPNMQNLAQPTYPATALPGPYGGLGAQAPGYPVYENEFALNGVVQGRPGQF